MEKVLVLASGGLDSSVVMGLYKNLGYEVHTLYIPYGNINEQAEIEKLIGVAKKLDIPRSNMHYIRADLNYSKGGCINKEESNPYVEMRNLIFLSYAVSLAESLEIGEVAVGFIKVPVGYIDTSEEFLDNFNVLSSESIGIAVRAPLMNLDKTGVYKLGRKFGIKLKDTYSCNVTTGKPCGICLDCQDIHKIIKEVGITNADNPFI